MAGLSRADIPERIVEVLQRGGRRAPDVYLVRGEPEPVVVKDFAPRGRLVRAWLAPWLVRRELRAYRALAGHAAVPRLLGEIDRLAFAVEYRPGRRLSRRLVGEIPPHFVDELAQAVREMHARGVAHLDLRHRSNVLVGEDGRPILIDFASAVCLRPGSRLLAFLARFDLRAVAKWRAKLQAGSGPAGASESARGASRPT